MILPIKAHADIAELAYPAMQQLLLHEAEEHGLSVLEQKTDELMIASPFGAFGITRQGKGVRLHVQSEAEGPLFVLRDALLEHLEHFLPDAAQNIRWSDGVAEGSLPPNFQFATVLSSEELGRDFYRLRLQLKEYDTFGPASIHFRFVLPAGGNDDPTWPRLKENGAIDWPKEDKALHRPVYTARDLDQVTGQMTVDVYRHDGGRMTEWVRDACAGAQIALIGPGGVGFWIRRW